MTFRLARLFALLWAACALCAAGPAWARQSIGATDSPAKLVFLDSTNLAAGTTWQLRINRFPNELAWISVDDALEAAHYRKEGT